MDNGSSGQTDNAELVSRLKAGDEDAFAEAVRRFGPRMLAVTRRMLRGEHDAQDAVQEAFLSAFRGLPNFKGDSQFSTWLHRITVNAALMKLRSARRKPERSLEDLLPKFADNGHMANPIEQWAISYDTAIADNELRKVIRDSIDDLPPTHRDVLLLRDIEGESTEKTAELLGITPGAVKTRLHRARLALRTLLDPYMRGAEK